MKNEMDKNNQLDNQLEDLSFYNPEGSELRKMQLKMLDMMVVLDEICQKHDITYWLCGGTLLGAQLHDGFIPWDDDLDVNVLYKDYNRLIAVLKKELPVEYRIQTSETDKNYWYSWAKIRDTNSVICEPATEKYNFKYKGIFLDIFPADPVISIALKKEVDKLRIRVDLRRNSTKLKDRLLYPLFCLFYPLTFLYTTFTRLLFRFQQDKKYTNGLGVRGYEVHRSNELFPLGKMSFEGKLFDVPGQVHPVLVDQYGPNYPQYPPVEKRMRHITHVTFNEPSIHAE